MLDAEQDIYCITWITKHRVPFAMISGEKEYATEPNIRKK